MKLLLMLLLALSSSAFASLQVYDSTCNLPTPIKHRWYVDPINGDDLNGLGTSAKPWKTVQFVFQGLSLPAVPGVPATAATPAIPSKPPVYISARYNQMPSFWVDPVKGRVFAPNPSAPVAPGDAIDLMTGNHGVLAIGVYTYGIFPSDWLTIEPAAGAKPVLASINISGISKLYFHDIKVQSSGAGSLVNIAAQGTSATSDQTFAQYPATDIIFDRMTMSSADDISTWVVADLSSKLKNGFVIQPFMARCVSLTNSNLSNVAGGFLVGGERAVIGHNTLNYFRDDGLDYYGNWLNINNNRMTNSFATTAIHKDFMQGQTGRRHPGTTVNHYHDILIDHNVMIGKTEAKNALYTYTQGIDTFDEDWSNMTVTNNTIIESSCYGISFTSVHNGEIANNIMRHDGLTVTPGCNRIGIGVGGSSHEGTPTDHVHVHHNIAQLFSIDMDRSNTWDNNIATGDDGGFLPEVAGSYNFGYVPPVNDPNNNHLERQVVQFGPSAYRYNMTIQPGSMAQTMKAGVQQ